MYDLRQEVEDDPFWRIQEHLRTQRTMEKDLAGTENIAIMQALRMAVAAVQRKGYSEDLLLWLVHSFFEEARSPGPTIFPETYGQHGN